MSFQTSNSPVDLVAEAGVIIHPTAQLGQGVRLGKGARIGPGAIIHDHVKIGAASFVGPGCSVGEPTMDFYRDPDTYAAAPTQIGKHAILRVGTIINAGTQIGAHFQTGPNVAIREDCIIGDHVSVGNNGDIQYEVRIGDYTRLHSNVTVGSGTIIGPFVWVHPYVVFTNDRLFPTFRVPEPPIIAPFTVIGVNTVVLPGAVLGVHVIAGSGCEIAGRIPSFSLLKGAPAERIIDARRMLHKIDGTVYQPYPWIRQMGRGYPWADTPAEERHVADYVPEEWREYL